MERPDMKQCSVEIQAYIAYQDEQIARLQQQYENLTNMFLNLQKKQFGTHSEKSVPKEAGEQLSLFNEAEEAADDNAKDPTAAPVEVQPHTRKRPVGHQEKLLENLPVKTVEFELPESERTCPKCQASLARVGKTYIRSEVEYIPAHVEVVKYYQAVYACKSCCDSAGACDRCEQADRGNCAACPDRPRTVFVQGPVPEAYRRPVLKHSLASASSVANVLYQKYEMAMPLNRQVQEWKRAGLELSSATLANWVLAVSRDWLDPLYEHMKRTFLKAQVVHCDETPVQVLREADKKATSDSYMWVYRTGECEKRQIALFEYQPSRSGTHAKNFLKGFSGYFVADGYAGYNSVDGAVRCGCWSHVRRKFLEAMPGTGQTVGTKAMEGKEYCDRLFAVERELAALPPEERYKARLERSKLILEAFWQWTASVQALPNTALGKAVGYATGQKTALNNFLLDGRIPISNNLDENAIRPFVVGRKNWLFSNCPRGAKASAIVYSVIQTAKANGLDAYKYLVLLLRMLPAAAEPKSSNTLERLAPWSDFAMDACKL